MGHISLRNQREGVRLESSFNFYAALDPAAPERLISSALTERV